MERALTLEWQCRWRASETGRQYFGVFERIGGGGWHPEDAGAAQRQDITLVARFLTGHYHLGPWSPSRDPDELDLCPLCGAVYSQHHVIFECSALDSVRQHTLGLVLGRRGGGLTGLAQSACAPLGRFLHVVRDEVSRVLAEPIESGEVLE